MRNRRTPDAAERNTAYFARCCLRRALVPCNLGPASFLYEWFCDGILTKGGGFDFGPGLTDLECLEP
jgi:hypothetical protein